MKYYLINNKIMKGKEKPMNYPLYYPDWHLTLQPCEISESELDKVIDYIGWVNKTTPHEITDIVEEKTVTCDNCINLQGMFNNPDCCQNLSQKLFFKHPKQVDGEIEAVEFLEWTLSAGYKLNPHYEQNRWNHIDNINSNNPLMTDGYTTKELYEIFKNRK